MSSERQQINSDAGIHHTLSRQILGIDWYATESSARRVIEWLAEGQEPVGYVVEKRTGSLTALSGVIRASAILEDFVTDGTPLYAAPVYEVKAQGVALDGSQLAGLLEQVRLDDDEAKPHGSGAAYWNNAVIACQVAIRDALAAPVQQVSVPDVLREAIKWADHLCFECGALVQTRAPSVHVYNKTFEAVQAAKAMLAAAPAAPAADACKACKGTGRRPIGGRGRIFGLTNRCFECQPLTDEEVYGQVTAHE